MANGVDLDIYNTVFSNCVAYDSGGALYAAGGGNGPELNVWGSEFYSNRTLRADDNYGGGAIYMELSRSGSASWMSNTVFHGNSSEGSGGAFYLNNNGDFRFADIDFSGHGASRNGGALRLGLASGSTAIVDNCSFTNVVSTNTSGGAIFFTGSAAGLLVTNSHFESCVAGDGNGDRGGAIYMESGVDLDIYNTVFSNCVAYENGGAVNAVGGANGPELNVWGSEFYSNRTLREYGDCG